MSGQPSNRPNAVTTRTSPQIRGGQQRNLGQRQINASKHGDVRRLDDGNYELTEGTAGQKGSLFKRTKNLLFGLLGLREITPLRQEVITIGPDGKVKERRPLREGEDPSLKAKPIMSPGNPWARNQPNMSPINPWQSSMSSRNGTDDYGQFSPLRSSYDDQTLGPDLEQIPHFTPEQWEAEQQVLDATAAQLGGLAQPLDELEFNDATLAYESDAPLAAESVAPLQYDDQFAHLTAEPTPPGDLARCIASAQRLTDRVANTMSPEWAAYMKSSSFDLREAYETTFADGTNLSAEHLSALKAGRLAWNEADAMSRSLQAQNELESPADAIELAEAPEVSGGFTGAPGDGMGLEMSRDFSE